MENDDITGLNSNDVRYTLSPDRPKTFKGQIERLLAQRASVPAGWIAIFDETIKKLRSVSCTKRDGTLLDEIQIAQGELGIDVLLDVGDRTVYGILRSLRHRSRCTCQDCGRGIGATYRWQSRKTQCARCHVENELEAALKTWLDDDYSARIERNRLFVGIDELPANVRLLINSAKVKKHMITSAGHEFRYVTPDTVLACRAQLQVIRRFLEQKRVA